MNLPHAAFPWLPSRAHADRGGATLHVVYQARDAVPPPPVMVGSLHADMLRFINPHTPDLGVLELSRPLVYGQHGWVFSEDGCLLPEHSWYGRDVDRMRLPENLPQGTPLAGTSLSLASDFAGHSYGHYLLDSLPRLHLFSAAGFTLDAVDHLLCHEPPTAEARHHFARLGVPAEKCVWLTEHAAWVPERLLVPTFPGTRMNYPAWVPAYLKEVFSPAESATRRRLWIGRTGRRRSIVNAAAVDRVMQEHGFEAYDIAAAANPADDFAAAAMVVSPHGGVLADLAFCRPGTQVLELLPTDHAAPYYYTLSVAAGLDYRCLACRSLHERPDGPRTPSTSDFVVDTDDLAAAVAGMASR